MRALALAGLAGLAVAAPAQAARPRLVAFRSCGELASYAKRQAARFVGADGLGPGPGLRVSPGVLAAPSAAAVAGGTAGSPEQGVDYSGTNVQETGVDEPDLVKTNGTTLFAAEGGQLESVDVSGTVPRLLDTLPLGTGWDNELLLFGTHLLVLSRGGGWIEPLPAMPARILPPVAASAVLTEVDVSDPSALRVVGTLTLDGEYVSARMIGSAVRVVTSTQLPLAVPFVGGDKAQNEAILARTRASAWIPTYRLRRGPAHPLVQCRDVLRPPGFAGLGMLTVTTIDLAKGLAPVDSTAVMTDGRIVYASPTTLYVASEPWSARPDPAAPTQPLGSATTQIDAFDISDPATTTYLGSGTVPGYLLSQWSLSEFQGVLRVVSTDAPAWWGETGTPQSQSYLTTLRPSGGRLVQVGQLGGLGAGERVYAVRFVGLDAYVVTFRQVDPLHAIDVSDPAHPRLLGVLDLEGYSAYLHPVADGLLLGIGQDVGAGNEPTGTQVSLFDVSDLAHPRLVAHASLGRGWSAAEADHHAFLAWPPASLVVVPFGQEAVGLRVTRSGIGELGRIAQLDARTSSLPEIDRAVVVGNDLLTVSSAGVEASSLTTLADVGWAPFPQPQPTPVPLPGGAAGGPPRR